MFSWDRTILQVDMRLGSLFVKAESVGSNDCVGHEQSSNPLAVAWQEVQAAIGALQAELVHEESGE